MISFLSLCLTTLCATLANSSPISSSSSSLTQKIFARENSNVVFNCSSYDSIGSMMLAYYGKYIYIPGIYEPAEIEVLSGNVFSMKSVSIESAGVYSCRLNSLSLIMFDLSVISTSSSKCTSPNSTVTLIGANDCQFEPSVVMYQCFVYYKGDATPDIKWLDIENNGPVFTDISDADSNNSGNGDDPGKNLKLATSVLRKRVVGLAWSRFKCMVDRVDVCTTQSMNVSYVLRSSDVIAINHKNDSARDIKCTANSNAHCSYKWLKNNNNGDVIIHYGQTINANDIIKLSSSSSKKTLPPDADSVDISPSLLTPTPPSSSSLPSSLFMTSSDDDVNRPLESKLIFANVSCVAMCALQTPTQVCEVGVMNILVNVVLDDDDDGAGSNGNDKNGGKKAGYGDDDDVPFTHMYIIIGTILSMVIILAVFVIFVFAIYPGIGRIKNYFQKAERKEEKLIPMAGLCLRKPLKINIPSEISLVDYIFKSMEPYLDRVAFIDPILNTQLTYREVRDKIICLSAALWYDFGVRPENKVGLVAPNVMQYPIMFYAIIRCGAVCVPISFHSTKFELSKYIEDSEVLFVVTVTELKEKFAYVKENVTFIEKIIFLEGKDDTSLEHYFTDVQQENGHSTLSGDVTERETLLPVSRSRDVPVIKVDQNDTVAISYSSGTTGIPKGCMHTHKSYISNLIQMSHPEVEMFRPGTDVTIASLTMSHMYAQDVYFLSGMSMGCTMVLLKSFTLNNYLRLAQDYKATCLHLVPSFLLELVSSSSIDNYDLSHLRKIETKAAPLTEDILKFFKLKLPSCQLLKGYGMTESMCITKQQQTPQNGDDDDDDDGGAGNDSGFRPAGGADNDDSSSSLSSSLRRRALLSDQAYSVGELIPGVRAKVVHLNTGECLGAKQKGELCIMSPALCKGYWKKPEMQLFDGEGFIRTGDVGYFDGNQIYVIDRIKDLIKCEGEQVPPLELEQILMKHQRVTEAAVIGIKNPDGTEAPRAYVVKNGDVTDHELMDFVNHYVARHKRLQSVVFIEKMPKLGSGKVLKSELRKISQQQQFRIV